MIENFVKAWDANNQMLREYISSHEQRDFHSYRKLVRLLFEKVINPYMVAMDDYPFDLDKIYEINDGEYQGTLLYVIPKETYQPASWEYVATYVGYGSCSGCDTLLAISDYEEGLPNTEQVKDYMKLCLHILQNCTIPFCIGKVEEDSLSF